MPVSRDHQDEIKKKLRSLKKLEMKIRFGGQYCASNFGPACHSGTLKPQLVWDEFFHIDGALHGKPRYSLEDVASLTKEECRNIFEEYFFSVYYRYYTENGIAGPNLYDPDILKWMGLPAGAGMEEIRRKFCELAKKFHPDTGGNEDMFIELIEKYNKLME